MQKQKNNRRRFRPNQQHKRGNSKQRPVKQPVSRPPIQLPEQLEGGFVLIDQEEFYGIYMDLVMFNFGKENVIKVQGSGELQQLKARLDSGSYQGNVYIIDETFGWGIVSISQLVSQIREKDAKSYIIGCTAISKEAALNPDIYDSVVVKSKNVREDNIVFVIADVLKQPFIESNADPNYVGKKVNG